MKRRKYITRRIWIGILCIALMMTMSPLNVFATEADQSKGLVYLALGDSITSGYGLAGVPDTTEESAHRAHPDNFVNLLDGTFDFDVVYNEAYRGNTAAGIAVQLTDTDIQTKAAEADIITITCGGNDLMAIVYENIAAAWNAANPDDTIKAEDVVPEMADSQSSKRMMLMLYSLNVLDKDSAAYMMDDSDFRDAIAAYAQTLKDVTDKIHQINPSAKVIVATQYNPYVGFKDKTILISLDPVYSGIEDGANQLNAAIEANAADGGYLVADVKNAFDSYDGTDSLYNAYVNSFKDIEFDFHPAAAGHALIADMFRIQIEDLIFSVNIDENIDNGSVEISKTKAVEGKLITVTAASDDGYAVKEVTAADSSQNNVAVSKVSDNEYTFEMPADNITVTASFEKVYKPEPEPELDQEKTPALKNDNSEASAEIAEKDEVSELGDNIALWMIFAIMFASGVGVLTIAVSSWRKRAAYKR